MEINKLEGRESKGSGKRWTFLISDTKLLLNFPHDVSDEPFRSLKASRAEQPVLEVQDRARLPMLQEANACKTAAKNAHRSRIR